MPIHTVLGPIQPADLGPTSMHEHVFADVSVWTKETGEPWVGEIGPEAQWHLRWNMMSTRENLILDDADTAVAELEHARAGGGSAIVDLTVIGIGRRVADLPEISRRSGMTIAVGCGWYVQETHPPELKTMSVDEIAEVLIGELREGIDGSGIKPAMIGEIGTTHPPTEDEWRVVRGAGRAGAETGAAVNVHLSFRGPSGVEVAEALIDEGMPADRIVLSHMDEQLDRGYHTACAQTGAILEYDSFGIECFYGSPAIRTPTDRERLDEVTWLLSEGYASQLVLGCDVWTKANLRRNGGNGYEHLFKRVMPALSSYCGADEATVRQIMVDSPRRLLDRP
ncbi:MAG TPA: phosphotriesterase [Conexibacter sp.]|nr:phosphotriesterase [Conexibacter sp.]